MQLLKQNDVESEEFKKAWKIYEYSFPSDERRNIEQQKKTNQKKGYNYRIIKDEHKVIGLIATWDFEDFSFIEHIAIMKEHCKKNPNTILEVERPENQEAINRIKFYEKLGFKLNKYDYIQPAYDKDKESVPLFIMSYPNKINEKEYLALQQELYKKVYEVNN
jgi:hypothetical protein